MTAPYGRLRPKKPEPEEPQRIEIQNTTLNTPPRERVEPTIEHVTVVYPDEHIETRIRSKPERTQVLGQVEPTDNPATRHWNDMASRGEKIPIIRGVSDVVPSVVEVVDLEVVAPSLSPVTPTMDAAGWLYASNVSDKRVIRVE